MDEVKGTVREFHYSPGDAYLKVFLEGGNPAPFAGGYLLHLRDPNTVLTVDGEFQDLDSFGRNYFRIRRGWKVTLHPVTERFGVSLRAEFEDAG